MMIKYKWTNIVTGIILFSLLGLMIVHGYLLSLEINLEKERFEELADKTMLDIHHTIEEDELLSDQLITILRANEKGQLPPRDLVEAVTQEIQFRIDTICKRYDIFLQTDFVIYRTKDQTILLDSRVQEEKEVDFTKYSERAGWRVRKELGKGRYRVGLIYHNKYVFMLRKMSTLLIFSGVLYILLISGVLYTIKNLKVQKELSSQKNQFINNLTHELKTPIFSTSLLHSVMRKKLGNKDRKKILKYLAMLEGENDKLKRQVEKILEIAQLDHGKLKLNFSECDIHQIIQDNMDAFSVLARQKKGKIPVKLKALHSKVNADPLHLTNVLFNLVDNALKYNVNTPLVEIETRNIPGSLVIRVIDNGIGIGKKNRDSVFEKFFRVNTGDIHSVKGFGLGLSYVKMIIEQHGGTIGLKSAMGKGTTFEIKIPCIS